MRAVLNSQVFCGYFLYMKCNVKINGLCNSPSLLSVSESRSNCCFHFVSLELPALLVDPIVSCILSGYFYFRVVLFIFCSTIWSLLGSFFAGHKHKDNCGWLGCQCQLCCGWSGQWCAVHCGADTVQHWGWHSRHMCANPTNVGTLPHNVVI